MIAALQADPRVLSVQPNFLYRHQGVPAQEADEEPVAPQYDHDMLQLAPAHALAKGRGVTVAVIDSAIDVTHPDLAGAVIESYDAVGGASYEKDTHGTAVAGLIRGRGAASGVAPESRLLAVRAFAAGQTAQEPEATTEAVVRGIQWAVDHGANVLNLSFTGPEDPALRQVLTMARSRGVAAVAAAGNGGPTAPPCYPAAYPEVIAVTAVDSEDRVYVDANRGQYIAVAAPGVRILAPLKGGGYELFTGTSFAAAEVSGVVALLLERKRGLDPLTAEEVLAKSSEGLGPDAANAARAGRVNALASLKALERP